MHRQSHQSTKEKQVLGAWKSLFARAANELWLAQVLLHQGHRLIERFAHFYERLCKLPRRTRRQFQRKIWVGVAGAALLLALSVTPAQANSITVNTNIPDINSDGLCSLIEAMENADNGAQTHTDCAAGASGADTIILPMSSTITLTSVHNDMIGGPTGLPWLQPASDLTIEGNGTTIERASTAPSFRILSSFAVLTLNNVTISGGHSTSTGGGIDSNGPLIVNNSTISGNTAGSGGGISSSYTLIVDNSTISDNTASDNDGGGIRSSGTLEITDSTISGNTANDFGAGGGISSSDTLEITDSTISGNSAHTGGGIHLYGISSIISTTINNCTISGNTASYSGGGILSNDSRSGTAGGVDATIINSTISGNTASNNGAGIHHGGGYGTASLTINNSTITGNSAPGGSLHNTGSFPGYVSVSVELSNTVIASQNSGADCSGALSTTNGYNLEGGTSCGFTSTGDKQNTDPSLGPLQDNGGPTETHALQPGSPAIDTAPTAGCSGTDQRGAPRNQDGDGAASSDECDIGAVEAIYLNANLINNDTDVEFTWSTGLDSYQLWRSEDPYENYGLFEDDLTGPSFNTPVEPTQNYYYRLHGLVGGETVHVSRRIGVFSFAMTPGSS